MAYEPITKCLCTNTWINYLKSKGWDTSGLYEGIEFNEKYMTDVENWMPSAQVYRLASNITKKLNQSPAIFFDMARWGADNRTAGAIFAIVKSFVNPGFIYDRMPKYIENFNKHRKVQVIERTARKAVLNIYHMTEVKAIAEVCEWTRGLLAAAPYVIGLPLADVKEVSCERRGDDCCQYQIEWKNRKNLLSSLFDRILRNKTIIEEQRFALEESQKRLLERFDELKKAKEIIDDYAKRLEDKVAQRTKELQLVQAKLVEQERLLTESHIAGGMAHEIRNALGAAKLRLNDILSSGKVDKNYEKLSNILETVKKIQGIPDDSLKNLIQAIRTLHDNQKAFEKTFTEVAVSTERGLQITNRVMEYSRLHLDKEEEEVDLGKIVNELACTYEENLKTKNVQLENSVPFNLVVKGSSGQFHSVFLNLLLNAQDAIIEKAEPGGKISIQGIFRDSEIVVEVKDTGAGIAEENIEKIFDPFFSTKPSTGMGLGLSECQKIVKQYGGRIEVESEAGKGTVFRVAFPTMEHKNA